MTVLTGVFGLNARKEKSRSRRRKPQDPQWLACKIAAVTSFLGNGATFLLSPNVPNPALAFGLVAGAVLNTAFSGYNVVQTYRAAAIDADQRLLGRDQLPKPLPITMDKSIGHSLAAAGNNNALIACALEDSQLIAALAVLSYYRAYEFYKSDRDKNPPPRP